MKKPFIFAEPTVMNFWQKFLPATVAWLLLGCVAESQYCIPPPPYTSDGSFISSVELGDINQTSSSSDPEGYTFFTGETTDLAQGESYTITIGGWVGANMVPFFAAAWIDYDQDSTFNNWGPERIGQTVGDSLGGDEYETYFEVTIPCNVPPGALLGTTRLRVRNSTYSTSKDLSPCDLIAYGETEDYMVEIVQPLGIRGKFGAKTMVYPNPTKGDLIIRGGSLKGMVLLEFLDLAGRNVLTEQHAMGTDQPLTIHLDGKLAPGNYVLRIISTNAVSSQPVVVR